MTTVNPTCLRKKRFEHSFAAYQCLETVRELNLPNAFEVEVYECSTCGGWHLGKHGNNEDRRTFRQAVGSVRRLR